MRHRCDDCQKVQTLIRRCVGDAAAGLGLHFLHMSEGPFSHDAGHLSFTFNVNIAKLSIIEGINIACSSIYVRLRIKHLKNMYVTKYVFAKIFRTKLRKHSIPPFLSVKQTLLKIHLTLPFCFTLVHSFSSS